MSGAAPSRGLRSSQLLFGWQSRFGSLDAYTGQVGRFLVVTPGTVPAIVGKNGTSTSAGHGMPRFEQVTAQGTTTRLGLVGDVGGQDIERLEWDWPVKVLAMSIYVKVYPLYTPAQSLGTPRTLLALGNATTGGGTFVLRRNGVNWEALRTRSATTITSVMAESGTAVFPIEVMATLSGAGALQIISRDAAADLRNGTTVTDANMAIITESFAGNILYLSGGSYRLEAIKIARGVQTFASMDLLH